MFFVHGKGQIVVVLDIICSLDFSGIAISRTVKSHYKLF